MERNFSLNKVYGRSGRPIIVRFVEGAYSDSLCVVQARYLDSGETVTDVNELRYIELTYPEIVYEVWNEQRDLFI